MTQTMYDEAMQGEGMALGAAADAMLKVQRAIAIAGTVIIAIGIGTAAVLLRR